MYRIKEIAKNQHTTLREIAEEINVAPNTLSRILKGENTTVEMLQKIASVLNVSIKDLFENSNKISYLIVNNELKTFEGIQDLKAFVSMLDE